MVMGKLRMGAEFVLRVSPRMSSTILMRTDLMEDPRVMRLAVECNAETVQVIGGLYWLWAMGQTQSHGGSLNSLTAAMVDKLVHIPGFAKAMVIVGWLVIDDAGVHIVDFDKYHGQSSKTRHQERLRKSRQRSSDRGNRSKGQCPAEPGQKRDIVPLERDQSVTAPNLGAERSGAERIRAEWIGTPPPAPSGLNGHAKPAERERAIDSPVWNRQEAVKSILDAYPTCNGIQNPKAVRDALYALGGIGSNRFDSEQQAADWLLERVRTWATSVQCITTPPNYRPSIQTWMRADGYDGSEDSWSRPYTKPKLAGDGRG